MAYASLSTAYLFSGMNRPQVFNNDMFKEEKISVEQAKIIGAAAKRCFEEALALAKAAARDALRKHDRGTNALLALVIATGAERDFATLVEKRLKDSYYAAIASQKHALKLQAIDPAIQDAWFTRGFSECLVASGRQEATRRKVSSCCRNAPVVVAISNPSQKRCSPLFIRRIADEREPPITPRIRSCDGIGQNAEELTQCLGI